MRAKSIKQYKYLVAALVAFFNVQFLAAQNWAYVPGIIAQDIAVGKNGSVWATGKNSAIYRWSGSSWETMPGGAERIAVDPEGAAWVIGSGYIFKYNLTTRNWEQKPGMAKDIGVGADGSVWVIGANAVQGGYDIYKWNGSNWNKIPGGAIRIAVDPSGNAWVVNSSNTVFRYNGSSFEVKPGGLKDIGISANGTIWCTGPDERIYQWNGNNWQIKTGGASWVSVAPDGNAWVVNAAGDVYRTTDAATSVRALYPRGQTYEFRMLQALRVFPYTSSVGGIHAPTYSTLDPFGQIFGKLALLAAEVYASSHPTTTAESILSDINNRTVVRQQVCGILAALVINEIKKTSTDAQTVALKKWATDLFRSIKVRCTKAVLDEYQKWKANPCTYSAEDYKPPVDCALRNLNIAALITSQTPPEDVLGKAGLKSVLANNADAIAGGVAFAASAVAAGLATGTLAAAVGMAIVEGTPTLTSLCAMFGGNITPLLIATSENVVIASSMGASAWAGVVAAPVAAAVLAVVVGTMEGIKIAEAVKVEPMLKLKLGAAMTEYINLTNTMADSSCEQMFFIAFQEASQNGFTVTQPHVDGEVRFYNQGGYVAQYRLSYTLNGQYQEFTTPSLSVGFEKTYSIPYNATNIKAQGWYSNLGWKELFNLSLDRPTYICYTSYGTVFGATYKTDCPEVGNMTSTQNQLTITQGGGYSAWIRLTYTENGQTVTKIDTEKPLNWREVYTIPAGATNIQLVIWSATGWVGSPWKEFVNKTWPTPPNECIKAYGTSLDPKWKNECN